MLRPLPHCPPKVTLGAGGRDAYLLLPHGCSQQAPPHHKRCVRWYSTRSDESRASKDWAMRAPTSALISVGRVFTCNREFNSTLPYIPSASSKERLCPRRRVECRLVKLNFLVLKAVAIFSIRRLSETQSFINVYGKWNMVFCIECLELICHLYKAPREITLFWILFYINTWTKWTVLLWMSRSGAQTGKAR